MIELMADPLPQRMLEASKRTALHIRAHAVLHTQREPVAVVSALRVAVVIGCIASRMSIDKMIPTILAAEAIFTAWTRSRVSPTAHRRDRRQAPDA